MPRVTELWTGHIEGEFYKSGKRVQRDAVWGGAVVETEPFAPAGMRWRYVSFFCARGQTPRVLPKPVANERAATELWRATRSAKQAEGYVECDWKDRRYNLEMTVRELGILPGEMPVIRVHDFVYGSSNNDGVAFCRLCGKQEVSAEHGIQRPGTVIQQVRPEPILRPRQPTNMRPPSRLPGPAPAPERAKPQPPQPPAAAEPSIELPDLTIRRGRRKSSF